MKTGLMPDFLPIKYGLKKLSIVPTIKNPQANKPKAKNKLLFK